MTYLHGIGFVTRYQFEFVLICGHTNSAGRGSRRWVDLAWDAKDGGNGRVYYYLPCSG